MAARRSCSCGDGADVGWRTGYDESKYVRMMHRTTLEGEAPLMAA